MLKFEDVLKQYEPMISASIRKLNIYQDHDSFKQAGRVALWQAWRRFDKKIGSFTPFAYRSIRGAMLDQLKKETRFNEMVVQVEDELLEFVSVEESHIDCGWSECLTDALANLSPAEQDLVHWLFVEGWTLADCAAKAGISVAGVKKRRERMLVKLRGILERG